MKAIPEFDRQRDFINRANSQYFRELALHEQARLLCRPIRFAITNSGSVPATDVRVEFNVELREAVIFDDHNWPQKPERYLAIGAVPTLPLLRMRDADDIEVQELTDGTRIIKISTSKVQPKQIAWIDASLFLGAMSSGIISLSGAIWSDDLTSPQTADLKVRFTTKGVTMTWRDFLKKA